MQSNSLCMLSITLCHYRLDDLCFPFLILILDPVSIDISNSWALLKIAKACLVVIHDLNPVQITNKLQ